MMRKVWLRILFLMVAVVNAAILRAFYDRYWYPADEGIYAHIAQRLLAGDVLNLNIQDLHPGYIHFVNTAAFWLFGLDLVSLRYPLVLIAFVQACLVYGVLAPRGGLLAAAGSIAVTAFGMIQFLDPTAHWYCQFLTVVLIGWMTWLPPDSSARTVGAGVLVGLVMMFRQLTGIWVAMAVAAVCLQELPESRRPGRSVMARALALVMACGVLAYLLMTRSTTVGGALLFASTPIAILCVVFKKSRASNRAVWAMLAGLSLGVLIGVAPLFLYHYAHGSIDAWLNDTVFAAVGLTQLEVFQGGWFSVLSIAGFYQALSSFDAAMIANGVYWGVLPLVSGVNGVLLLRQYSRGRRVSDFVFPTIAAFYALVSLHLEGPVYLYYTIGLSMAAVLWSVARATPAVRTLSAAGAVVLAVIGVVFHAAQSYSRTPVQVLAGHRTLTAATPLCAPIARASLRIERADCDSYRSVIERIRAEVPPGAAIFALPSDPELYFLADRPNPFGFYSTALGIRTDDDLRMVLAAITRAPPRVVAFRPADKYNTPAARQIMAQVRTSYDLFGVVGGVELYRPHRTSQSGE